MVLLLFLYFKKLLTLRPCARIPMCLDCWFMHEWQIKTYSILFITSFFFPFVKENSSKFTDF